jgi:hypothetical protein
MRQAAKTSILVLLTIAALDFAGGSAQAQGCYPPGRCMGRISPASRASTFSLTPGSPVVRSPAFTRGLSAANAVRPSSSKNLPKNTSSNFNPCRNCVQMPAPPLESAISNRQSSFSNTQSSLSRSPGLTRSGYGGTSSSYYGTSNSSSRSGGVVPYSGPGNARYSNSNSDSERRYRYKCEINDNQDDAGGLCNYYTDSRREAGDNCKCSGQRGTIR